jgi:hypothetical protein
MSISGDSGPGSARLSKFQWAVRAAAWSEEIGPQVAEAIRQAAPVGRGPGAGRLRDATRYRSGGAGAGMVRLEFYADGVTYVPFVLYPTRAHDIVPRNAKALHWSPPGGGDVFARRVHHPGTRGNNYPPRAAGAMRAQIVESFKAAFEKM